MKYTQFLNVPKKDLTQGLTDLFGKEPDDEIPGYTKQGIFQLNWVEKFETTIPSVLLFTWDFEGKIFDESFKEYLDHFLTNRYQDTLNLGKALKSGKLSAFSSSLWEKTPLGLKRRGGS